MTEVSSYTLVHESSSADQPSLQDLRFQLEKGNDPIKIEAMKRILVIMLNGDSLPFLLMHVIRFVMPSKNKALKKLLHFYWEICPKLNPDGKLKQEMILVCNAIRNDLQHPNEYIRGATLRFLSKLKEPELLDPLIPSVRACLEHRHAYVRKNAVFAIYSVYTLAEHLVPDAAELILGFLETESDTACKRNAFVVLSNIYVEGAVQYVQKNYDTISSLDELLQLAFIEFIRKDAGRNAANKARYLRLVFDLLEASSNTVVYEAATALTALTSNPVAIKAAAAKFIELSVKESDNNVKLIVLDRVDQLRVRNEGVLDDLTMEILRVLSSPDIDVRRKALDIALEMISSKNVQEVILLLKKELTKTLDQEYEKNNEYRHLLIHAIHLCAIKFAEVASSVVELLLDFITGFNSSSAVDVISFVKEVVEKFPDLRQPILSRLVSTLGDVRSGKVSRGVLWIVGEYASSEDDIKNSWKNIRSSIGELPILAAEQKLLELAHEDGSQHEAGLFESGEDSSNNKVNGASNKPSRKVLPDGTYATESALTSDSAAQAKLEAVKAASKPPLRQLILDGDYYLASTLSSTLTKLVLRFAKNSTDDKQKNLLRAEAMLILISILRVGQSQFAKAPIDEDSVDRIMSCIKSLSDLQQTELVDEVFLQDTHAAFRAMVVAEDSKRADKDRLEREKNAIQIDDSLGIRQLAKKSAVEGQDEFELDLSKATGSEAATADVSSKLSKVVQLTGFSDTVYAEAYVKVHQFDILLDVLLVNQTTETLQNLTVEFATLGDLKVVEKPTTQNLGPHAFYSVQAAVKVSSTDTGVIFGNIVYDGSSSTENNIVILNDVHVDIMDYIQPGSVTETQFRTMWTEFEWENKVNINSHGASYNKQTAWSATSKSTLKGYLDNLVKYTNMAVLTPENSLKGDCQFLSANLYARSVFGEDALANLSIEKEESGNIVGHIRIRSKGQGLALSLGDRIAAAQRQAK
ncbi:adaptin N terminal region-domain-containing protein [Lipomyces japonicus]|uniref:adaptin N terminal region-domain-containing protein n=1 Tax=Lipomyces japonicus TaxID=56871 RepID=UPI0034CF4FE1